ncbi:MAG: hypothetical protein JWL86_5958 [Rhizobium sp.]|nr:hypothetical protein [Rhizobium sp.]
MPDNPDGFEENPQAPLSADDEDNVIDESIWGAQKKLTPEEQAEYDVWFRKKVGRTMEKIKNGTQKFYTHDEVMAHVEELLERLDREAGLK